MKICEYQSLEDFQKDAALSGLEGYRIAHLAVWTNTYVDNTYDDRGNPNGVTDISSSPCYTVVYVLK